MSIRMGVYSEIYNNFHISEAEWEKLQNKLKSKKIDVHFSQEIRDSLCGIANTYIDYSLIYTYDSANPRDVYDLVSKVVQNSYELCLSLCKITGISKNEIDVIQKINDNDEMTFEAEATPYAGTPESRRLYDAAREVAFRDIDILLGTNDIERSIYSSFNDERKIYQSSRAALNLIPVSEGGRKSDNDIVKFLEDVSNELSRVGICKPYGKDAIDIISEFKNVIVNKLSCEDASLTRNFLYLTPESIHAYLRKARTRTAGKPERNTGMDWTGKNRIESRPDDAVNASDLTDTEWDIVSDIFIDCVIKRNNSSKNMRFIINSILYVLSKSCSWSSIPENYCSKSTAHRYFFKWKRNGKIRDLHTALFKNNKVT
jgi:hypothetical protein